MSAESGSFDPAQILVALVEHGVEYIVIGGIAARAHGAARATDDLDCVPKSTRENLDRLARALVALGAYLRVGGMTDEEARALPLRLDGELLSRTRVSTWMTVAGPFDVLMDIPDRTGARRSYEDLAVHGESLTAAGVVVTVADLDDIIQSKEYANRPKDHDALVELRVLRDAQA